MPSPSAPPPATPAPAAPAPAPAAQTRAMSYEEALASIGLGPKAQEELAAGKSGRRRRQKQSEYADDDDEVQYIASIGRRPEFVGEGASQRKREVAWPDKLAKVRLRIRADCTFELEARCWGPNAWRGGNADPDEDSALMMEVYGGEVEWFSPPDYCDGEAALLKVTGELLQSANAARFRVRTVEEQRNGRRRPPITEDDIYAAAGKSLLNGIDVHFRSGRQEMTMAINRHTDWSILFVRDASYVP